MADTDPCEYLTWDSEFFKLRIARVIGNRLTPERSLAVFAWSRQHQIDCLYFLADCEDSGTVAEAARRGFLLTDIRVQFEMPLVPDSTPVDDAGPRVRPFQPGDLDSLRAMAANSHRDTRFYFDGNFLREQCDELYATWIQRSTEDFADAVFVAEHGGKPAGYISCHLKGEDGSIGLIAVHSNAHGQGLGFALVRAALAYFRAHGMRRALVVTQGRNIASQRLYQRAGFRTESVGLWYHVWPGQLVKSSSLK